MNENNLPKSDRNEELEITSENKFRCLFPVDKFLIRKPERDKGIDFQVGLKKNQLNLGYNFLVQLKATESIEQNVDGSYSKPIEFSNLDFILRHNQPAIYVLYIDNTGEFYYEWAKDFYKEIFPNCKDANIRQKTYNLRFSKPLDFGTISKIHNRVFSYYDKIREELDISFKPFKDAITKQSWNNEGKPIIDVIYDLFKQDLELVILPPYFLPKLFPFSKSKDSNSYQSKSTLYTDNEELYSFLNNIIVKDDKFHLKVLNDSTNSIKDLEEKISTIVNYLQSNQIDHIRLLSSKKNKICIHNFKIKKPVCDCEHCSYWRGDFNSSFDKISNDAIYSEINNRMKKAYVQYQLGLLKESVESFEKLSEEFKNKKKYINFYICQFNLTKLKRFLSQNYFEEDREDIMGKISNIDLDTIKVNLKNEVSSIKYSILEWIQKERFINNAFWNIDKNLDEILEVYHNDQNGGWSSNSKIDSLSFNLVKINRSLKINFLIYDSFSEFARLINKSIEGYVAIIKLQNTDAQRLEYLYDLILLLLIYYGDTKKIQKTFHRYKLNHIPISKDSGIEAIIQNVYDGIPSINHLIEGDNTKPNYFFRDKINKILGNSFLLLSRLEITSKPLNKLIGSLLNGYKYSDFYYPKNTDYLVALITNKGSLISKSNLIELLTLSLTHNKVNNAHLTDTIIACVKTNHPNFKISTKGRNKVLWEVYKNQRPIIDSIDIWDVCSSEIKKCIKNEICSRLVGSFDFDLCYDAAMAGIINYQPYLDKLIASTPKNSNASSLKELFGGKKDVKNFKLNYLINLTYKYEIDLSKKEFQKLHNNSDYYKWLLNLKSFDYTKFNPYWILEFRSIHYYERFKEIPAIHTEIKSYLKENKLDKLSEIYLKYFI